MTRGSKEAPQWTKIVQPFGVIFGSTLARPADEQKSGFQVGARTYKWMFPSEMDVVTVTVTGAVGSRAERDAAIAAAWAAPGVTDVKDELRVEYREPTR